MGLPKPVTKYSNKNGVTYISNVDAAQYTIKELSRAALRDVAKMLRKKIIFKLKKLQGMKKNRRIFKSTQYWVRKREADLQIGFKHGTWYGFDQELGTNKMKKLGVLRDTVFESLREIQQIEAQYLSGIANPGVIDESEAKSGDGAE